MRVANGIAVQSYCFRGFSSNEEVAAMVRDIGLDRVEPYKAHIDFTDAAAREAALAIYRAAGVDVVSCGVNSLTDSGDTAAPYFQFAQKAGSAVLSADVHPPAAWDTFAKVERLAEQYNVDVGLHNHGGQYSLGNAQMLEEVFKRTGPRVGLMLDTAWAIDAREDPIDLIHRFGDRIKGVHLKDFVYTRDRKHRTS
jgi:sugar phosphate isomerase/epimerase